MIAPPRTLAAGVLLLAFAGAAPVPLAAQTPDASLPQETTVKTPAQALAEVKAANARTLEQQAALLKRLEELKKQADQLRIFSKRG